MREMGVTRKTKTGNWIRRLGEEWKAFLREEDAVGVVEIILVLVVLIALVLLFKEQLTSLVQTLLAKVVSQSNAI